ncbi:P-loop containing nucleoside triphosphate hydrolase protein [Meredithblackwellia eburnea MCA 4105]
MKPLAPFVFPTLPATWFIGHMSRALREMQQMVQEQQVDLIIETRDSRLPLTSLNPAFERILHSSGGKYLTKRLIVYNKADLAQECFQKPLQKALYKHGEEVLFTDSRSDRDVKKLLETAIRMSKRELEGPEDRISLLVAGMPNVGKSSLLNALRRVGVRKGKAASTSSMPGHTRRLSTVIKISENPPVYIHDTPGIMVPFLGKGTKGKETALKLALTGGIKESLFEGDTLSEYLLWRLRSRCMAGEDGYSKEQILASLALPPSTPLDNPPLFLDSLARRLSAMKKGGEPDTDFAGRWLIQAFREGKLGRWTLDGLGRGGEAIDIEEATLASQEQGTGESEIREPVGPTIASLDGESESQSIEEMVGKSVSSFLGSLATPSLEELSGHQAKKQVKASQAAVREIKRKSRAVVQKPGVSSARRRKYRR